MAYRCKSPVVEAIKEHVHTSPLRDPAADDTPTSEDITENDSDDDREYPEGGAKAWFVVFGSWCALFASLGVMNSLGTFQAYISANQLAAYDDGTIGWIFSIYTFLAWFCGIYIGPLFDKYGPKWLVLAGSICLVGNMMLLGLCKEYWHFVVVFGLLGGVGTSLLFTPSFAVIGHYFNKRRGNATGIASTGASVGGIVFPLVLEKLIPEIGFPWSTRIIGFLCLVLCIVANIFMRSGLPAASNAKARPDVRIFKNIMFTITTVGVFFIEWGLFVPLTYISSYALSQGFDRGLSYQILPIMNVGSVLGRWLPGYYADRLGRYNVLILSIALNIITVFGVWLPAGSTLSGLVIFALLSGFASGSNVSLVPVCIGQLCKTESYGTYYATCYTIVSIGCLTGIPIAGEILERCHGHYWGLIIFVGLSYVGALGAFVGVRVKAKGWRLDAKY